MLKIFGMNFLATRSKTQQWKACLQSATRGYWPKCRLVSECAQPNISIRTLTALSSSSAFVAATRIPRVRTCFPRLKDALLTVPHTTLRWVTFVKARPSIVLKTAISVGWKTKMLTKVQTKSHVQHLVLGTFIKNQTTYFGHGCICRAEQVDNCDVF